jgi:hypothetical protein
MVNKCPYCDAEDALVADVWVYYTDVPLREDGYIPNEGTKMNAEEERYRCSTCKKEVPAEWVFDTI